MSRTRFRVNPHFIIHVIHIMFEDESTEAVLMDDAANALNSVNREAFVNNIFVVCLAIITYVRNYFL